MPQENSSRNLQLAVPFFMVTDMDRSLLFYTQQLKFEMINQWTPRGKIEWCWLDRDGVSFMLQQPAKTTHWIYTSPDKKGFGITISIQCSDAIALYQEFKGRDLDLTEPFVGNNRWVFSVKDPDGYNLEFESPTKIPEETKYKDWLKTL